MPLQTTPSRSESQSTLNKFLQKDLKELVLDLDSNQLINLFRNLEIEANVTSSKQFIKIGLKCSECHTTFENFQSKGYGRDQHQALINSIKIILESMISSSYRIQNIKRALKYCSKYKKPLINPSQGTSLASSSKKYMKKVQGTQGLKIIKKHLQFENAPESSNKQNVSQAMNETLNFNSSQEDQKIMTGTCEIRLTSQKVTQQKKHKPPMPQNNLSKNSSTGDNKCFLSPNAKDCIYYQISKHSENEIKNLNARLKLLQDQNSMLKEILMKDFYKQFVSQKKQKQVSNQ